MPQLIYSPWAKFCGKGQESNAKQVCFTGKDGRIESGQPVIAAVIIEPEGEPKKLLRVTLPLAGEFAKAYDGPPTDPKQFEENQKKLQEELQKKAEEQRKKLEGAGGANPAAK